MLLTPQQTNSLLEIIQRNQSIFITKELGPEFLSEYDRSLLESSGVDWQNLYSPEFDSIYSSFHLGMLAQSLKDVGAMNKMTYEHVRDYVKRGEYIPITSRELATINSIKTQTFSDIKALNGRIFQDINNVLVNTSRQAQEEFLRTEIEEGLRNKKSLREISNTISSKTGDWSRDFDRIVEYQCNTAYQEGRVAMIQKDSGDEAEVYKLVFASACKHCLRLYTTEGFQSEPRVFKISEIRANGTNIGRRVDDWKPVIGSTHPYCRCLIFEKRKGFKWNTKTQSFDIRDESQPILKKPREKIRVRIAGKEVLV